MESFDVIIVGAGPAGLKCAETLGNSKYKVLLLEKNSEIGPKVCAGALSDNCVKYLNLPQNLIDFQCDEIIFHINNSKFKVKKKCNLYTVDRKNLGQWQLKKLKEFKNVEVRTNSRVTKIEKNFILVSGKKISYKFLVGADGSASIVRRHLGIKSRDVNLAIQYIIPTKKCANFEFFFNSRLFSAGYAWIIPHKDYVSVGCISDHKIPLKNLKKNFNEWLKKNQIDVSNTKYEAFLLNYDYQGYEFGNIFLVGDAGGFVSGLTGGGIYQALVSGEEVGKIIINKKYKSEKIYELLKINKKDNKLMSFLIKCGKLRTVVFYILVLFIMLKRRI